MNYTREDDKYYTDMDRQLQEMALTNWADFVRLIGDEAVTNAKVCMLKSRGLSHQQVSVKLKISFKQSRSKTEKCICNINGEIQISQNKAI